MNYFQFYDLPYTLEVDLNVLKQKFYQFSKQFHPDFFTLDGIEKQMEVLEKSTLNNKAFNTLKDFNKRLHYILLEEEILEEEGKNQLPQDFLMEMMDLNEEVMELQFDFDSSKYEQVLKEIGEKKGESLTHIQLVLSKEIPTLIESEKELLRNYYLESKYLDRLVDNVKKLKK